MRTKLASPILILRRCYLDISESFIGRNIIRGADSIIVYHNRYDKWTLKEYGMEAANAVHTPLSNFSKFTTSAS